MIVTENISSDFPVVVIFSDYNLLTRNIAANLKEKGYQTIIVTTDNKNWLEYEDQFVIQTTDSVWNSLPADVNNILIFVWQKKDIDDYLISAKIFAEKSAAKTLVVTKYAKDRDFITTFKNHIFDFQNNKKIFAGTLYLADVFENSHVYQKIADSIANNELIIGPTENYYLIKRDTAAQHIIKNLMSLAVYGNSLAITSMPISAKNLFKSLVKFIPELKVSYKKTETKVNESVADKEIIDFDIDTEVKNLVRSGESVISPKLDWQTIPQIKTKSIAAIVQHHTPDVAESYIASSEHLSAVHKENATNTVSKAKLYETFKRKIKNRDRRLKFKKLIFILLSIMFLPLCIFLISLIANKIGDFLNQQKLTNMSVKSYRIAKDSAFVSKEYTRYLSNLPFVGSPYERSLKYILLLEKDSKVSYDVLKITDEISLFFSNSFNKKIDNLPEKINPIALEIDSVYKEYGLLKSDMNLSSGVSNKIMNFIVGKLPSDKEMSVIYYYKEALTSLPKVLGDEQPIDYALVLADNRVRRPGGGVIEAIAIATFEQGNLTNIVFYDAAELDVRLQGFASPPSLLSENSNIDRYYLKDALWSPHFPKSVDEIAWFLEKEIGQNVQGVLLFDINFLSEVLKQTGPGNIDGKQIQGSEIITSLKLGSDDPLVQDTYFKELFTVIINRMIKMNTNELRSFLVNVVRYMHSKNFLLQIDKLGQNNGDSVFNRTVDGLSCNFSNCLSDFISVAEIEFSRGVGINKQADIIISFEEGVLKRDLTVYYKNQSGVANEESFSSNLVLSIPQDTSISPVTEFVNNQENELPLLLLGSEGYKQAVIKNAVNPGEVKAYNFKWENGYKLDYSEEGQYRFRSITQPGEDPYLLNIIIKPPSDTLIYNERFDLTNDGLLHYNTQLSEDIDLIFTW